MAYVVYHTVKGRSLPAGFEPALLVANFLLWMFMFGILFWCVTSLRAMFRMKKAYGRKDADGKDVKKDEE